MTFVTPKKSLGQHFLTDHNIARKIVNSLDTTIYKQVVEIGPGMGVLTNYLKEIPEIELYLVEIDKESVEHLKTQLQFPAERIIAGDFLKIKLSDYIQNNYLIIGNFPYNISSQIFFNVLDNKNHIPQVVCMIQKEVAERIATGPGSKTYGILSVLLQAFYDVKYLFTVHENVFIPPPKVKSAVISLTRNDRKELGCNEKLFFITVKTAFNQRRKTLRNSLNAIVEKEYMSEKIFDKRPEQLSVKEFCDICIIIENARKN
jgi:16S rRNA (adenine1518-N6/adenine1519-N6)-dimethyltransferase